MIIEVHELFWNHSIASSNVSVDVYISIVVHAIMTVATLQDLAEIHELAVNYAFLIKVYEYYAPLDRIIQYVF